MNNPHKHDSHNFWSGFALGAIAGGAMLYMFATKRGRKTLNSLLKGAETVEHDIEGIFEILQNNSNLPEDEPKKGAK